ncbi:MAG: RNA polymerase sigma-70 factor [Draconibacterium sp.]|nr:RNA polymerase sigma-70 factor [Draconibacterium sp.]
MEDNRLWENIKRGDVQALNKLHSIYFKQMCLFARKMVNDDHLVENIVSDCFIKLWENRKKIQVKTSLKSYIYAILRNQITDYFRSRKEFYEIPEEASVIPDESVFTEQERYVKLHKVIAKLPEQRKKILELAVFDELSYKEIADNLGISKNTVKTQMARAYKFLKESLEPKDFFLFYFAKKKRIRIKKIIKME